LNQGPYIGKDFFCKDECGQKIEVYFYNIFKPPLKEVFPSAKVKGNKMVRDEAKGKKRDLRKNIALRMIVIGK
jgi:hypothetical protein